MAFARIFGSASETTPRIAPLAGGKFGDSLGPGHTSPAGHKGLDIYPAESLDVRAVTPLEIIRIEDAREAAKDTPRWNAGPFWIDAYEVDGAGNRTGYVERYEHLDRVFVRKGKSLIVPAGTVLGTIWKKTYAGEKGHLHFEVRTKPSGDYGDAIDPAPWLKGKQGENTYKIVAQLNQEDEFNKVQVGELLYAKSGQRLEILSKLAYPWLIAKSLDVGAVTGEVTRDIGEAANWTLDDAEDLTHYSFSRWGLHFNTWKFRVEPLQEKIAEVRKISDDSARYSAAWDIRKEIANIAQEGYLTAAPKTAAAFAGQGAKTAKAAAKGVASTIGETVAAASGSLWDSIPSGAKTALVVAGIGVGALVIKEIVD